MSPLPLMLVTYIFGIIQKFVLRSLFIKLSIVQGCYTILMLCSQLDLSVLHSLYDYFPSVLQGMYGYKMFNFFVHYRKTMYIQVTKFRGPSFLLVGLLLTYYIRTKFKLVSVALVSSSLTH